VGVSRSDPDGLLATPVETVPRDDRGSTDLERIIAVAREHDAIEVVVGLPISLSGADTASTGDARGFAERLAGRFDRPVRLVDERLSTVSAEGALHSAGHSSRRHRPVIDQVAAVIILQHALDSERMVGSPPGSTLASSGGS
jgi:putative holliday junction resolvase